MSGKRFRVFLSHCSADKPAVETLATKLLEIGVEPFLDRWNLVPGDPWQEGIEKALVESDTCAVFLGPNGVGPWENEEMRVALDRRAQGSMLRVIPVLLPATTMPNRADLPAFLTRLVWVDFRSGLDDPGSFRQLVAGIRGEEPGPPRPPAHAVPLTAADDDRRGRSPYRGIEAFGTTDADIFFGRAALTQYLVESLRERRFLAVVGPSGCGKSSVVRAGLVPALQAGALPGSAQWPILIFKPGRTPLTELTVRLLPHLAAQDSVAEQIERLTTAMHGDGWALTTELRQLDRAQILLVIDQFEEIFTQTASEVERQALLRNVLNASGIASGRVVVVIVLRADFYVRLSAYPDLADRVAGPRQVIVSRMTESELWQAINLPAQHAGLHFERGLVEEILQEMSGQGGALSLLQQALLDLWKRREGETLTIAAYRAIGGVKGSIAAWAESVYEGLSTTQQSLARRILVDLVQPGEATGDTRRRALLREISRYAEEASDIEDVVERLIQSRLLITDRDPLTEERMVEIAHEALPEEWPRLREWIDRSHASRLTHARLRERIRAWEQYGKDAGSLLRGAELNDIDTWSADHWGDLSSVERDYIDASRRVRRVELTDRELLERLRTDQGTKLDQLEVRGQLVQSIQTVGSISRPLTEAPQAWDAARSPSLQIFIRLSTEAGMSRLSFELSARDSALGLDRKGFGTVSLHQDLRRFAQGMMRELEQLAMQGGDPNSRSSGSGTSLFRSLPEALQATLWELQGEVGDITIVSDEPYIPWEVVKLGRREPTGWKEGPFLCEAFTVTRWFRNVPLSAAPLLLRKLAVVVAMNFSAAHMVAERDALLALDGPARTVVELEPTLSAVMAALRSGDFDGWHFIGPGIHRPEDVDRSELLLREGQVLMPRDLAWGGESLSRLHPLVFLNTSTSGRGGFSLTGPGGWPLQFVEAGAGAFIGPQWNATDQAAQVFAVSFYQSFLNGVPLGESVRRSRLRVREELPGDPSWLAYVAYGHPEAVCSVPSHPSPSPLRLPEIEWREGISPPSGLLRAEFGVVPFHGRDGELAEADAWCHAASTVSVRLYVAPGGTGKTRLAHEIVRQRRAEGWLAGLWRPAPGSMQEEAAQILVRSQEVRTMVVIDQAEVQREAILSLLRGLHERPAGAFRLILLARAKTSWWDDLRREGEDLGTLVLEAVSSVHRLAPVAVSLQDRSVSYRLASEAFASLLHREPRAVVSRDLGEPFYEQVLFLHTAALMDLASPADGAEAPLLDSLLAGERQVWVRRAVQIGLPPSIVIGMSRAMAAFTLAGGVETARAAIEVLRHLHFFDDEPATVLASVAQILHDLYGDERWIEPLLPDLLGEHLVQYVLESGADDLLNVVLGPRKPVPA